MNTVETVEYRHMGQVVPRVWVGSLAALSHLDSRQGRKWTVISILSSNHIIKMTSDVLSHNSNVEEHVVWVLKDSAQAELLSEHHLPRVFEILNAAGSNSNETNDCLIHCAKGCSRSVSVCAAWLLHSRRYTSLQAALERIRRVRPNCNPNLGFVASLRALEQCNGDVSRARERLSRSSSVGERDRRDEGEIEVMTDVRRSFE